MKEDSGEQGIDPATESKLRIGIEVSLYPDVRIDQIIRAIEMAIASVDHTSLTVLTYKKVGP